ncbi:hypothetical protein TrCOL_g6153 [Triparma columacea]|uniref:Uncharacterized protein n=1 Tax=Triparma columacea TaxID=722753 RepID=A0A9W7G743_9STRA|nr:hypothetical protein TrCOL_g6153 [Triparma columacea]
MPPLCPTSIWGRIYQSLAPPEVPNVESAIGISIIAENEALLAEHEALEAIFDDLKTRNDLDIGSRLRRRRLPDTKERMMMEDKVRMLLGAIKRETGGRVEGIVGERDRGTLNYFNGGGEKGGGGNNGSPSRGGGERQEERSDDYS